MAGMVRRSTASTRLMLPCGVERKLSHAPSRLPPSFSSCDRRSTPCSPCLTISPVTPRLTPSPPHPAPSLPETKSPNHAPPRLLLVPNLRHPALSQALHVLCPSWAGPGRASAALASSCQPHRSEPHWPAGFVYLEPLTRSAAEVSISYTSRNNGMTLHRLLCSLAPLAQDSS